MQKYQKENVKKQKGLGEICIFRHFFGNLVVNKTNKVHNPKTFRTENAFAPIRLVLRKIFHMLCTHDFSAFSANVVYTKKYTKRTVLGC